MLNIDVPGFKKLELEYLVLDFNGTIAEDGKVIDGVEEVVKELAGCLDIRVLTADTHGTVRREVEAWPCQVQVLERIAGRDEAQGKLEFVEGLGADRCVCLGNGRNDRLMLAAAGLGVAVLNAEGASALALAAAHLVCLSIRDALDLLRRPARIIAGLRC